MIFVTVGTHEQPFNRLLQCIDELKKNKSILEDVMIQTGYSTYKVQYCQHRQWFSYSEMLEQVKMAHIVITHGGPSSFIMPLQEGKIPIVVPRKQEYGEHVNNHQIEFVNEIKHRNNNIIVSNDIAEIKEAILNYEKLVATISPNLTANNMKFCKELNRIVEKML